MNSNDRVVSVRAVVCLLALLVGCLSLPPDGRLHSEEPAAAEDAEQPDYSTRNLRGKIVWMSEALERRFGVATVPEASERMLVLEARDGTLYPIVEDVRGRSLRKDERLRNLKDVELMVRQYDQSPFVQIIRIYSHEDGKRFELDYWCEICAIAMFELKACDCCQGPIELRKREAPVKPAR